jgi:hypothetical protein
VALRNPSKFLEMRPSWTDCRPEKVNTSVDRVSKTKNGYPRNMGGKKKFPFLLLVRHEEPCRSRWVSTVQYVFSAGLQYVYTTGEIICFPWRFSSRTFRNILHVGGRPKAAQQIERRSTGLKRTWLRLRVMRAMWRWTSRDVVHYLCQILRN